jgi:hypothetical protein
MDVAEVERLIEEADERCLPLVGALIEMYGEGLAHVVGSLPDEEMQRLCGDPLVAQLLILHGLHPVSAENRVREAIAASGAYAVVVGVSGGVVRVKAADDGRRKTIEDAVARAAPDLEKVEFVAPMEPVVVLPRAGG